MAFYIVYSILLFVLRAVFLSEAKVDMRIAFRIRKTDQSCTSRVKVCEV